MRLLFDEQLSSRLPRLLCDLYPDSLHIESLGHVARQSPGFSADQSSTSRITRA